jgi:CRP/FNR family transcriptional regulator, cyclic AMP receptor protein
VTASGAEEYRGAPRAVGGRQLPGRPLLALDPELGQLLTPERRSAAEHELRARVTTFPVGEWDGARLTDADPTHLGLLMIEGVLAREVVLADTVSTELLGPGDVVRPWHVGGPPQLLSVAIRWNALADVRLALIDRRLAVALGSYPEIGAVIVDRMSERAQRLAITQAISQLNRVDRRLVALFWHLAERWGRVSRDGIAVPLALSHRLIGELVGARRPTVSTALAELARTGQLVRRDDGTWLLTGDPPLEQEAVAELVRQRRRLMPEPGEAGPPQVAAAAPSEPAATGHRPDARLVELRASLAVAREQTQARAREFASLQNELRDLREQTLRQRQARTARIDDLRAAATRRDAGG